MLHELLERSLVDFPAVVAVEGFTGCFGVGADGFLFTDWILNEGTFVLDFVFI